MSIKVIDWFCLDLSSLSLSLKYNLTSTAFFLTVLDAYSLKTFIQLFKI